MPQNNLFKVADYQIKASDIFFFDNNIWMYLFCPLGKFQAKKQTVYSKFLSYALSRKSHIYVNSLVLSEFANRYLKLDFDLYNEEQKKKQFPEPFKNFKSDYMGSLRYQNTVKEIKGHLKIIIGMCQKCSDEFNAIEIDQVFNLFVNIGFNDSYYIHLSKLKNWLIVSDDSDFTKDKVPTVGLTILTA